MKNQEELQNLIIEVGEMFDNILMTNLDPKEIEEVNKKIELTDLATIEYRANLLME